MKKIIYTALLGTALLGSNLYATETNSAAGIQANTMSKGMGEPDFIEPKLSEAICDDLYVMYGRRKAYEKKIMAAEGELKGLKEGDEKFRKTSAKIANLKRGLNDVTEDSLKDILKWFEKEVYPALKEHNRKMAKAWETIKVNPQ